VGFLGWLGGRGDDQIARSVRGAKVREVIWELVGVSVASDQISHDDIP
jgi:hypothetical protein